MILIFLAALILGPRPLAGWLDLESARRFQSGGDSAAAAAEYASAARRLPWRADLWENAGLVAFEAGQPEAAIQYLESARERRALSSDGWLALGDLYSQTGDMPAALAAWRGAGDAAGAHERLARAHREMGDFSAAIEDWRALLALEPGNLRAHYDLGLLLAASEPEAALPELMQASADPELAASVQSLRTALNTALLSEDEPYRFLLAGRALAAQGEWDLAAESFRRSLGLDPDYAAAWAWLGEAEQHLGQDGLPELEKALQLDPSSAMVNVLYGMYWQRQGQPGKALAAYREAVRLEPDAAAWHVALGSAYEQDGNLVFALLEYLYAVALDPADAAGWRALALYSISTGYDLEGTGQPAAQRLLELAPDDWLSHDIAGQAAFALGNFPEAGGYFLKAIELAPQQGAPHLHLALVYLELGDRAAARAELETARALDPEGPDGWQAGRLLEKYFP